jgi:chemotaxis protein methyltransferase CheR
MRDEGDEPMRVSKESVDFIITLLHRESGLVLDSSKTYLIEARLEPIAGEAGLGSIDALCRHLKQQPTSPLLQKVVDAMATNETSFFRDVIPFDIVRNLLLPDLLKSNQPKRQIRIWSAACATGQEAYSLGMLLCDIEAMLAGWNVRIMATDLVERVLERARNGIFTQYEIQRGLPAQYMTRFFDQVGIDWKIRPEVKRWIEFKRLNLLCDFSSFGQFDIIFCRNILIYFDNASKKKVLEGMAASLTPNGALFLGGGETPLGITDRLVRIEVDRGVYYRRTDATLPLPPPVQRPRAERGGRPVQKGKSGVERT